MISAEAETVLCRDTASYGSWLRKSCLPIVLMALPAWAYEQRSSARRMRMGQHLRWLYQVGRFFGTLDDAADYGADMRAGSMNYFRLRNRINAAERSVEFFRSFSARTAMRAQNILRDWDKFVKDGPRARLLRQTFLNLAWAWLPSL